MELVLNKDTLRCVWGDTTQYWFSHLDYTIHTSDDLPFDDTAQVVENGFIPFLKISNEELIRAYIKSLNNKKVSGVFDKLSTQDCVETFWKYFNAYPAISQGFDAFEDKYVLDKMIEWCDENGVKYRQDTA